jgi:hypothetical protein
MRTIANNIVKYDFDLIIKERICYFCQKTGTGVQVKPIEPIFVATPPRTNRLLHTHTYMKYKLLVFFVKLFL